MEHTEESLKARVENKRPTFITLPPIVEDVSTPQAPNRTRDIHPEFRLGPNTAHDLPLEYIEALEELPPAHPYHMYKECGYIVVTVPSDEDYERKMTTPEGIVAPENLLGMPEDMALALIKAEDNTDTLRMWQRAERGPTARPKVKAAIVERLGK